MNLLEAMQTRIDILDTNVRSVRGLVNKKVGAAPAAAAKQEITDAEMEFINGLNPQERDMVMERLKSDGGF